MFVSRQAAQCFTCRAIFLIAGCLPTTALLGWVAWTRTPMHQTWQRERVLEQIHEICGLEIQAVSATVRRGSGWQLDQVRWLDSESKRLVAQLPRMAWTDAGDAVHVDLTHPHLQGDQLDVLLQALTGHVLPQFPSDQRPIVIQVDRLTIDGAESEVTLEDVRLRIENVSLSVQCTFDARLAGEADQPALQIKLVRDRRQARPTTMFQLKSLDHALPCWLLADVFEPLRCLGARAEFRGQVWGRRDARGVRGELSGQFFSLDLDQLVTERFPHKLSGQATLTLEQARVHDGRLLEAAGLLEAPVGTVSRSLLAAAASHFEWQLALNSSQVERPLLAYEKLKLGFLLNDSGLQLSGDPAGEAESPLQVSDQPALLIGPRRTIPIVTLLRVLVPDTRHQVPATQQTDWLLRVLPIPPLDRNPVDTDAPPPYVPIRLKD